ncbi:6-phosphogluconolactonase [Nannocystaceae bacterium ST9]
MSEVRWCDHRDGEAMAVALALVIRDALGSAIAARGRAILALSGGATPWPTYERLAEQDLAWARVVVVPSDDRMVPVGDPLSNVGAMARIFEPLGARVEPLTDATSRDHVAAGRAADQRLRGLPWPLDFVLLGVGGDGHTASIFPGKDYAAALDPEGSARALGVMPDRLPPEAPVARVSLSLAAIVAARAVAVVAIGSDKRAVIERAIAAGDDSPYPVGRVLAAVLGRGRPTRIPNSVRIFWAPR